MNRTIATDDGRTETETAQPVHVVRHIDGCWKYIEGFGADKKAAERHAEAMGENYIVATDNTEVRMERRTEAVHSAMAGALLHGWEMERSDMRFITLTHESGETIDVTYSAVNDEWTVESDALSLTASQADVVTLAADEMFRVGRKVGN